MGINVFSGTRLLIMIFSLSSRNKKFERIVFFFFFFVSFGQLLITNEKPLIVVMVPDASQ